MRKTNEEIMLELLLKKYHTNKNNNVNISRNDLKSIELTESDAVHSLDIMQKSNWIEIHQKSVHNDFRRFWSIILKNEGIHYFENKKAARREIRNQWIQFWIPVVLSLIAIIISAITLIIEFV